LQLSRSSVSYVTGKWLLRLLRHTNFSGFLL
jgi:hypothetical protein